jgi:hypothetical protein
LFLFKLSSKKSLLDTPAAEFKQYQASIFHINYYLESVCSQKQGYDKIRLKRIIAEMQLIDEALSLTKKSKTSRLSSNVIVECAERVEGLLNEPLLNFFPDIHLWLLCDSRPVGICTIKSADVLWSSNKYKIGSLCNELIYVDVKVSELLRLS